MNFLNRPLDHINVTVPNMEKAIAFYTEVLHFKIQESYTHNGRKFVFVTDGNVVYELMENAQEQSARFDHMAYSSEDIEADYAYFKKEHSELLATDIGFADFLFEKGMYYFFVNGLQGERIEFCQRKK